MDCSASVDSDECVEDCQMNVLSSNFTGVKLIYFEHSYPTNCMALCEMYECEAEKLSKTPDIHEKSADSSCEKEDFKDVDSENSLHIDESISKDYEGEVDENSKNEPDQSTSESSVLDSKSVEGVRSETVNDDNITNKDSNPNLPQSINEDSDKPIAERKPRRTIKKKKFFEDIPAKSSAQVKKNGLLDQPLVQGKRKRTLTLKMMNYINSSSKVMDKRVSKKVESMAKKCLPRKNESESTQVKSQVCTLNNEPTQDWFGTPVEFDPEDSVHLQFLYEELKEIHRMKLFEAEEKAMGISWEGLWE